MFTGKRIGKTCLGRSRRRREKNIRMDIEKRSINRAYRD